jgi:hypothetical protein
MTSPTEETVSAPAPAAPEPAAPEPASPTPAAPEPAPAPRPTEPSSTGRTTSIRFRRAIALFLPVAAAATLLVGLVYVETQQLLRLGGNDPQLQMAEDAATALDAGAGPDDVVGQTTVDVAQSLAPFTVVFASSGAVLATDGQLDGQAPMPPIGVLEHARQDPPNTVTWQPRAGVRIATVTVPWSGGTVLVGRSLRVVEQREDVALELAVVAWLAIMGATAVTALIAGWLWPGARPTA